MKAKGNIKNQIWRPYTQMANEQLPVKIVQGEGTYLYDNNGVKYIDAIASWWTNIHGHAHPYIARKIYEQALQLEHVIFAGLTHPPAEELALKLLERIPFHSKIFYSDNGSTAVEVALKMALQFWWNKGEERRKVIAFKDAYHGDTFGAMSASARSVFTAPYQKLLFDVEFIETPVKGRESVTLKQLRALIESDKDKRSFAAFIFEPLVLGSSGMWMYESSILNELIGICRQYGIITIADEVMTGFGRTGKFLATDYCENKPDIICLSKGITGGFMPFAATSCTDDIYDAFLSDEKAKMFFHGHSYTANPLGCAAAIASLELFEVEGTFASIARIEKNHSEFAQKIKSHKRVKEVRQTGTIVAVEIETGNESGYLNNIRDKAYRYFMDQKIILRPLGNVIYILPPYCISNEDLRIIYNAIEDFLNSF